jgi:hypothetical protein
MKRVAYQTLGYVMWKGAKWYVRQRFGETSRRVAVAVIVLTAVGAMLLAGWRTQGG